MEFFPDGGKEFYEKCTSLMKEDGSLTTEEAIEKTLRYYAPNVTDDALRRINEVIAIYIEFVARRFYKQKMLQALDRAGVSVEIYGNNWEDESYQYGENIHIHSRISPEECNRLMGDTKITLNFLPWHKNGSSERPFNTMLNGSVCLIDESPFLSELFVNEEDILFFDMSHPEKAVCRMKELLEEPDFTTLAKIAENGYKKCLNSQTWSNRAESILEIITKEQ